METACILEDSRGSAVHERPVPLKVSVRPHPQRQLRSMHNDGDIHMWPDIHLKLQQYWPV